MEFDSRGHAYLADRLFYDISIHFLCLRSFVLPYSSGVSGAGLMNLFSG